MTTTASQLSQARAELLRRRLRPRPDTGPVISRRADDAAPPLSFAQERLWFMDQLVPDSAAYALPLAVRLRGAIDPADLRRALAAVADRHEPLRTRFESTPDGRPVAIVAPAGSVPVPLSQHEVDPRLPEAEREAAARTLVAQFAAQPFDLSVGPLVRATLIRLGEADHVLVAVLHHIAADGWSLDIFLADLLHAWQRIRDGGQTGDGPGDPEPAVRYGDYAAWQRQQYTDSRLADDLAYWSGRLAGVPPLELPTDHPRPARPRLRGASCGFDFGERLGREVAQLARRLGGEMRAPLVPAAVVPRRTWCCSPRTRRCCTATPARTTSRSARRWPAVTLPELERLVGLFANVLALRADLSGDPTFAELVSRVREQVLDGFAHQETPFDRLVAQLRVPRDVSRSPVFQAMFTLLNYARGRPAGRPGCAVDAVPGATPGRPGSTWSCTCPSRRRRLSGRFIYNTDLFDAGHRRADGRHLERAAARRGGRPDAAGRPTLDLLDAAERDLVLRRLERHRRRHRRAAATLPGLHRGAGAPGPRTRWRCSFERTLADLRAS